MYPVKDKSLPNTEKGYAKQSKEQVVIKALGIVVVSLTPSRLHIKV